jgi:hypothetical protein
MEVSGQLDAPAALPRTRWIEGCVGPTVGLDVSENTKALASAWKRNQDNPSHSLVTHVKTPKLEKQFWLNLVVMVYTKSGSNGVH